jgi:N-acetylglucosaminyl-diphospho-decaprenol L-rhamnosyltransferase
MTHQYTISIVSHGHGALLEQLLEDLDNRPALAGVRVILTWNLGAAEFDLSRFNNLEFKVLSNEAPRGFGANHNRAFRYCETAWFVVLNPDLRLTERPPFESLLSCAKRLPDVGLVAPVVVSSAGAPEDSVRWNLTPWSLVQRYVFRRFQAASVNPPHELTYPFRWLAGMCLMVDSEAFRAVGGFDERFFLYCEDYDLCARLYNSGHRLLLDRRSRVVHDAQRGSHRSRRHLYWHITSLLRVWTSRAFWQIVLQPRQAEPSV